MQDFALFSPKNWPRPSPGVGLRLTQAGWANRSRAAPRRIRHAAAEFLALAFFFLASAATSLGTQLVYDNGSPNQANAYEMTLYLQANAFTLTSGIVLGSITFWDAEAGSNFQNTIYWEICANSASNTPGAILFSGTSTSVTHTATGGVVEGLFPEFVNTVALPTTTLLAGNYWLVLHDGPITNTTEQFIFWETAANNSTAPSLELKAPFTGNWLSNSSLSDPLSQMAFQLYGVPQALWPSITAITRTGTSAPKVSFTTVSGQHYSVEYKNNLTDSSWTAISGATNIAGTGGVIQVTDPDPGIASVKRRFYHVILL